MNNCWFENNSFISIDFETLYVQRETACSVGCVKYINGEAVDTYYSLIQPPFECEKISGPALEYIHGFTCDMFTNERRFPEILKELEIFIGDLPLVAHNASVEKSIFKKCCEYYGIETTTIDYENIIDTLSLTKQLEKRMGLHVSGKGSHRLDTLCEMYEISTKSHHNALDDSYMCGDLLVKMNFFSKMNEKELAHIRLTVPEPKPDNVVIPGTITLERLLFGR